MLRKVIAFSVQPWLSVRCHSLVKHRRNQGDKRATPPNFLAYLNVLCFETRVPNQVGYYCSFKDRRSRCIGLHYFRHNSPVNRAREVFKPSTDAANLLVYFEKICFCNSRSKGSTSHLPFTVFADAATFCLQMESLQKASHEHEHLHFGNRFPDTMSRTFEVYRLLQHKKY